jgi:membrane protease YdiL (CAAX protease family)
VQPSHFQSRRFALSAIAVGYVFIECALWTRGRTQLAWSLVAAFWIVWTTLRQKRTAQQLGIGARGLLPSLWVIPAATGVALLMAFAGKVAGTLHGLYGPNPVVYHSVGYAIWAILQEFILQSFFYVNVEQLAGNRLLSTLIAAVLFAAAHSPNPLLVSATLVLGLCFTQLFRRYRNIYALGIAHGLLGLALAVSVSDDVSRHMRVGLGYLLYRPNPTAPAPPIFGLPRR